MSYYVISSHEKKRTLLEVFNKDKLLCRYTDQRKWSEDSFKIQAKDIVLHLGEKPPLGNILDVYVEPVIKRVNVKGYGEIYFYSKPSEKTEERICRAFVSSLKWIRELGPQCDWELLTEVRNPKNQTLKGKYHYKSKGTDVLTAYDFEGESLQKRAYTIVHELGHGIWFRHLTAEERADWIELYDRYIDVKTVSPQQIKSMVKDIRQLGSIRDYSKNCEPEEIAGLQIFLAWLKKVHNMPRFSLQDLLTVNGKVPMPDTHLHRPEMADIPVTEYSCKSAEEMFSESLATHFEGNLNNKQMRKMLKRLR